jgi:hypothetical protein
VAQLGDRNLPECICTIDCARLARASAAWCRLPLLFVGRAIGSGWQGPLQFQGMERPHPREKACCQQEAWTGWQGLSVVTGTALSIG